MKLHRLQVPQFSRQRQPVEGLPGKQPLVGKVVDSEEGGGAAAPTRRVPVRSASRCSGARSGCHSSAAQSIASSRPPCERGKRSALSALATTSSGEIASGLRRWGVYQPDRYAAVGHHPFQNGNFGSCTGKGNPAAWCACTKLRFWPDDQRQHQPDILLEPM